MSGCVKCKNSEILKSKMKPEDGPWVSLPSKHHPNEVYYFNVLTAESRWEKPQNFCEPVDDSTNLQCLAKPTTPEKTGKNSYIVESLSPSTSPKKPRNVSKPASEVQQKEGREKRSRIILQRNRFQVREQLFVPKRSVDVKRKSTKDANEAKSKDTNEAKNDKDLKSNVCHPIPQLSKSNNEEGTILKAIAEERLQRSEKKISNSSVTNQKIVHSEQYIEKVPRGRTWEQHKSKDYPKPNFTKEKNDAIPRRGQVTDIPVVCGAASLRMELLKKQLREDRLKKSQRSQSGKKYNSESSRDRPTDSSYNINQQKPSYNMSLEHSSTILRNHRKDDETDWKGNEVNLNSWEWSSRGFVRDYNHKSITVSNEQSADTVDNRVTPEKCARCNVNIKSASVEKEMKARNNVPAESTISTLSKKPRLVPFLPSFPSYPERSGVNLERLPLPKKTTQLSLVKERFGISGLEYENSVKDETSPKIGLQLDYHLSGNNINLGESGQNRNSQISKTFFEKMLKQKSHDSKGGISKINRRVQKQLRTTAPKLIHLPSASVKNVLELSHQEKDLSYKTEDTVKFIEEEMDWEPIEPEKVVKQVEELRKEGSFQNTVNPELVNLCNMEIEVSQWFVVLDTNVLLSNLPFVRGLRDTKDAELGMPTLFIPWVVLQELDHLKSTQKRVALQSYARRAINFIHENLLKKHPRVGGQSKAEADEYDALEPDDSILQCSINLQKHSSKILLLTNDRNLFNKAVVNGVECCSALKLMQELENRRKLSSVSTSSSSISEDTELPISNVTKLPLHSTVESVKQCLGVVLEELLRTEMVLVYDRKWSEIVVRKPPWTLNDILFCLLKHWVAVFRLVLPSAARELIEKIRVFVNNEYYETTLESVGTLVKTSLALMHLVSSLSYKQYVDNALKTLNKLHSSLKEHRKLSTSSHATSTFAAMDKADNTLSNVSTSAQLDDSDGASVLSRGEQHTQSTGSGIDSRKDDGSSIADSKVDTDDCLSLFASSFSEDIGNNQLSDGYFERGQELTHKYLNKIWEKISMYCGMLCDVMGVEPCVPYQRPEPFPAVETLHQNMLSFVKCVSTLLRCMEGILFCPPSELRENSPILLNFYNTINESLPTWSELGEVLLPQHVLVYCTQTDSRQQLEHGKKQFEQFEAVLNQAVTFFMGQNQSLTSLPSF